MCARPCSSSRSSCCAELQVRTGRECKSGGTDRPYLTQHLSTKSGQGQSEENRRRNRTHAGARRSRRFNALQSEALDDSSALGRRTLKRHKCRAPLPHPGIIPPMRPISFCILPNFFIIWCAVGTRPEDATAFFFSDGGHRHSFSPTAWFRLTHAMCRNMRGRSDRPTGLVPYLIPPVSHNWAHQKFFPSLRQPFGQPSLHSRLRGPCGCQLALSAARSCTGNQ